MLRVSRRRWSAFARTTAPSSSGHSSWSCCIRREYKSVGFPKLIGVVEWHMGITLELAIASFLETPRLLGEARSPPTGSLSAEACKYACDVLNMTARVRDKPDVHSPYRAFRCRAPLARLLPSLMPGFHRVKRTLKSESKAEACLYLKGGNKHSQDCCKVFLPSDRTSYSRDVTLEYPRKPFIGLLHTMVRANRRVLRHR